MSFRMQYLRLLHQHDAGACKQPHESLKLQCGYQFSHSDPISSIWQARDALWHLAAALACSFPHCVPKMLRLDNKQQPVELHPGKQLMPGFQPFGL